MASDLKVRVTTRASRERIVQRDGTVHVHVCAAPVDGEANKAVCELLAEKLHVAKSRVTVVRGKTSRDKTVRVDGLTRQRIEEMLRPEE